MAQHLVIKHRYRVPKVRLSILNTEMAVIGAPNAERWLATTAYSNRRPCLALIRPDGRHKLISTPHAGGMMQADERGRLVFGVRDLATFDPASGRIRVLAKSASTGIWGGCVTRQLIVAGASTPDGMLTIYDRAKSKVVRQIQPLHPRAFYHFRALETPDGKVLIMSSLPNAVLTLLEQGTLETAQFEPAAVKGATGHQGGQFLGKNVFYLHSGRRAFLLSYPDFETLAEIRAPAQVESWGHKTVLADGRVVAWGLGANQFYVLDEARRRWEALLDEPLVPPDDRMPVHSCTFAALPDGALCGVTSAALFFRIKKGARRAEIQPIEVTGLHNGAPLLVVPDKKVRKAYGSSHCLQRLWQVDLCSGKGEDLGTSGPGGGQLNDLFWDPQRRKIFMGSYTSCTLMEYDPARGGHFPDNPRVFAKVGHGQMRPLQLIHDGDFVWMTTSPYYGTLGGALSRIDLRNGSVQVVCNLAANQTPVRMVHSPDRRTLYLSMTVEGDCGSSIAKSRSAHLVVFDTRKCQVVRTFAPFREAPTLLLRVLLPDGKLLFQDGPNFQAGSLLWTWNPESDQIRRVGMAPDGLREVLPGPSGRGLWATAYAGIGPLTLGNPCKIQPALDPRVCKRASGRMGKYLQWAGRELWFITGSEVICATQKG